MYKTLVLTGLREDELRTGTVGQLDLAPGPGFLQLDAVDEKNREGNAIPIRDDLAADLGVWLDDKLTRLQGERRGGAEPAKRSAGSSFRQSSDNSQPGPGGLVLPVRGVPSVPDNDRIDARTVGR
jgi:hypothetical protein